MKTIERIRETVRPMFEGQEDQGHKDERIWPFILWIFLWLFISEVIGMLGCALIFNGHLDYEFPIFLVVAALLFKPMGKLYAKAYKARKN